MTKTLLLSLLSVLPLFGQQEIVPNPAEDVLMAATEEWLVWNRARSMNVESPGRGGVWDNALYLQRIGDLRARLVYRDTIGGIQSFVPVWVRDANTVIGWDGYFQRLRGGVVEPLDFMTLPGSLYYPVLCGAHRRGVLMLTQNDQKTTDAYERVYFVPWSSGDEVIDIAKAVLITDSLGIPFFWPSVRWKDDVVLAWRPPTLFRYDLVRSRLDSLQIPVSMESGGPSHISAFDGKTLLIEHGPGRMLYSLQSRTGRSISLPADFTVFTVHDTYIYGVVGAPLTKSDTLTYLFQAYDTQRQRWQTLYRLNGSDVNQEVGLPVIIELPDRLLLWSGGRWQSQTWLK